MHQTTLGYLIWQTIFVRLNSNSLMVHFPLFLFCYFYVGFSYKQAAAVLFTPDTHCFATVDRPSCSAAVHSQTDKSLYFSTSKINFSASIIPCLLVKHLSNASPLYFKLTLFLVFVFVCVCVWATSCS